ncbi:E3 ubiquitin-protein ligase PEP5 [Abortiporus biennis]
MAAQEAAPSAWKQFTFFDVVPVKDVHDLASAPEVFKKTPEISCIVSTTVGVVVADIHGSLFLLDRDFDLAKSWIAHSTGRVTHMVEQNRILVTLGEEDNVRQPLLKIWDLGTNDSKTGAPLLLRSVKIQSGSRPHPVTTIALSASLAYLTIGLADGTVLLYRHLDQSIFTGSSNLTNVPKPRVVHESASEPITGLGFKEPGEDSPNIYLFIITTNHVLVYQASGRGSGGSPSTVDEIGCGLGCASMDWRANDIIVARDEAVYICGTDGRGACYAYEGTKSSVYTHLNYLVIISPPFVASAGAPSATVRNFVAKKQDSSSSEITKVTVLDLENKFVAYSGTFTEGVREVFSASGQVYLLSNSGKLSCLEEKPTPAKLDLLYRKSQYLIALNLAKTQRLDDSSVADIHRQYGDHLYSKGDYDGAMQQFVQTIGHVQPSYVVRKFLDAQRIHNLVTYLQELHSLGLANADHTTLLLNTYTKLKDVSRLDNFIKTESKRVSSDGDGKEELPFDLDTAIRVCRQAGYYDHASYLAKKYERHEDVLQIQIEDAGNYKEALNYLRRLGTEAAEHNLARYGRAMLDSLPEETTQLLIDVCTSLVPLTIETLDDNIVSPVSRQPSSANPGYLSLLALNRAPAPAPPQSGTPPPPSPSVLTARDNRRSSVAVDDTRTLTPPPTAGIQTPTTATGTGPSSRIGTVKRPSPRLYFAHFIEHKDRFIQFLENVAKKRWGQSLEEIGSHEEVEQDPLADPQTEKADQIAVWNTLLELYLPDLGVEDVGDKAMKLLKSEEIPYDSTHALILCSTRNFTPGLVYLWEKMGMYEDVLRFWMDKRNSSFSPSSSSPSPSEQVIRCLSTYGPSQPKLYPLVLRFLTSTSELLTKHKADVMKMLEIIEEEKIMPPLAVVKVLSRNDVASVGLVKEWLMMRIKESQEEVETDQKLIDSYRIETQMKLKQVEDLSDPDHPRIFHVTQCSACKGQLDLPSVHFMCNHSYHQRCLGEHDTECPNCARQHSIIREIRRNNERLADQHEIFLSEVKEGGFEAVANGFGRGIMNLGRVDEAAA